MRVLMMANNGTYQLTKESNTMRIITNIFVLIIVMVIYILCFLVALEIVLQLLRLIGLVNKESIKKAHAWNKKNISKMFGKSDKAAA